MEYQRQIHLQRLAEQEAEMQARLDQQRRYAQQREQQNQMDYRFNQVNIPQSIHFLNSSSVLDALCSTPSIRQLLPSTSTIDECIISILNDAYVD